MTEFNRTVGWERSNLDQRINLRPNLGWTKQSKKSFWPPAWGLLWSHSVVEIAPKVTLRKKLQG